MHRSVIAPAVLALSISTADAVAEVLPPAIAARIADDEKFCDGPATLEHGFVSRQDVNADGISDYVLDYAHLKCGTMHGYCGSGGCTHVVFASSKSGFVKVIDDLVGTIHFRKVKGRPAAILVRPGSACGKIQADACYETLIWNGSTFKPSR
jgi:hypothetical protein